MKVFTRKTIYFDQFEINLERRLLFCSGVPLSLNPKAFDLLMALVEERGSVLSKDDLLERVWPGQFVEENNLTVHIAALRKLLGERKGEHRFIITVPGFGYKFIGQLHDAGTETVIEQHKLERIIVEEEIEKQTSEEVLPATNGYSGVYKVVPREIAASKPRTLGVVIAVAVLLATIGGGYALRDRLAANFVSAAPFAKHSVRQLTTNGKAGLAALSPDGKLFAYTVDDLGQKSLWLGYVDGGNHLLLIPATEASYRTIVFSPDGKDLYFSLSDEKNPKFNLYRMPVFGGARIRVLENIGSFSLSPDGKSIAIARRDKDLEMDFVVIAPLDGTQPRDIASFPQGKSFRFDTISWSADGTRLGLSVQKDTEISADEIAVVELESGELTRIKHDSLREITKTAWLRNGSGLIVTAIEQESDSSVPQYVIYRISYPSGELHKITSDLSNYGASWHNDSGVSISLSDASDLVLAVEHRQLSNVWVAPSQDLSAARQITFSSFGKYDGLWGMDWTPDGRLIYTTSDTKSQFLSQMNGDGSDQRQITAPDGFDSVLTVAQSGRYIVFHSDRNSTIDIWRTDIDGANPRQLTFGGKGFHPAPSPDGKWVYYKSNLKGNGHLCRVPIDGGEPEILTDKETSWISFSPDGKYFAASYITDKLRLAVFSAETNQILKQFDLPKTGTLYMGSRWTPDSKAVTFRDNAYGYWIQPINGDDAVRLEGLPKEKFYNMSWSKDGKWFAFVRGQEIRDLVLLTNGKEE